MSEQTLLDLSDEKFKTIIDQYIERGSQETDDVDADIFFDALADLMAAPTKTTIELSGHWLGDEFILSSHGLVPAGVTIRDNCIITPDFTFVVQPSS